jgi:glycosyltransferase involved in cell wall biosynthesis
VASTGRRFLLDASTAQGGGGFTYIVSMLPHLVRLAPDDRFRLVVRNPRMAASLPPEPNLEVTLLPRVGLAGRLRYLLVDAPRLAARWKADVYLSVSETSPPRMPCPKIASFRNLAVVDRQGYGWTPKQRLRLEILHGLLRISARSCDRILFVSEDSARWMGGDLKVEPARRAIIHHGIDLAGWQKPADGARPRHPRPYILSVSSIYRYKNYLRLIEAWAQLARRLPDTPDLLIVGDDQDPPYAQWMREARSATGALAERIHILGEVPFAEVKSYYAGAELFVLSSVLETFGHPLLEAMASGLPLIASDLPVFREIAGDAALYADPERPEAYADAMERVLTSSEVRESLLARGRARVAEFTWTRSAERHLELLREVAGG